MYNTILLSGRDTLAINELSCSKGRVISSMSFLARNFLFYVVIIFMFCLRPNLRYSTEPYEILYIVATTQSAHREYKHS